MDGATYTRLEEGCRLACYDDATGETLAAGDTPIGTPTIGVGETGPDIVPGLIWTQAQCDDRYARRYAIAELDAATAVTAAVWSALDIVRRAALASMAFNLGDEGVAKFVHLIAAVQQQDWQAAHAACLASRAAQQLPARYGRLAQMFLTGCWQPGYGG